MRQLLASNWMEAQAITHGGVFHADDVFSAVLLHKLHPDWCFFRVEDVSDTLMADKLLFDVGGGVYDHHQQGFSESRPSGVKYAAFGLLWRSFGMELLKKCDVADMETAFDLFDSGLVSSVDAHDNGQWERNSIPSVTVSHLIAGMNPLWNEEPDYNGAFLRAFTLAETIFDRELGRCAALAAAKNVIVIAAGKAEHGVLELPFYIPWQKDWLIGANCHEPIRRVIYPSLRGGFCISCVDRSEENLFPKAWAGLRSSELALATGIESALFCHPGRFLCAAEYIEDARKVAYHK